MVPCARGWRHSRVQTKSPILMKLTFKGQTVEKSGEENAGKKRKPGDGWNWTMNKAGVGRSRFAGVIMPACKHPEVKPTCSVFIPNACLCRSLFRGQQGELQKDFHSRWLKEACWCLLGGTLSSAGSLLSKVMHKCSLSLSPLALPFSFSL